MASIHCLAVEFDDVSVGVDDVDLRVTRDGLGTELHLSEVVVGKIVAEAFAAEPRERIAIALHAQCEVNVVKVDPLVAASRRVRANQNVELLLSVANLVPDSRIVEGGAVDFLHFQDVSVELSRTFQVVNGNENMMEVKFAHGRPSDERSKRQTTCCTEESRQNPIREARPFLPSSVPRSQADRHGQNVFSQGQLPSGKFNTSFVVMSPSRKRS